MECEGLAIAREEGQAQKQKKGISGSTIKIIAVVTMLIDHIAAVLLTRMLIAKGLLGIYTSSDMNEIVKWLTENAGLYYSVTLMRLIGRLGFPLFCFLLVEGFQRTRDIRKYAFRLGLFALISEVPFDLAVSGKVLEFGYQNVYFTLFVGILALWGMEWLSRRKAAPALKWLGIVLITAAAMGVAELLQTDYAGMGVLTIVVMYLLRKRKVLATGAGCAVLTVMSLSEITAFFALIPVALYNGTRGLKMKYFFYVFYPLHLLLIWLVALIMGMGWMSAI